MRRLGFAVLITAGIVAMGQAETRKVDFTQDGLDQPPKGFEFGHTAGVELEGSFDYVASGLPKAGEITNGTRFLDDASPWSFSIVVVIPVAPF